MAGRCGVLEIVRTGPLSTVQDLGRPGLAALGVGRSGAVDPASLRLANRLVGNPEPVAAVEVTYGGLVARVHGGAYIALAGAPCPMSVDGREEAPNSPVWVPDGAELRLGTPTSGLRSYLAVRGGLEGVEPVLGSRSTDTLAGLGPAPLAEGDRIELGQAPGPLPPVDLAPVAPPTSGEVVLRVVPGPRADWFSQAAHTALLTTAFEVTAESDRVGMRLAGPRLERIRDEELPSEGMVCGALQVPPSGQPTLFLADHPVTGGYPVIAVVLSADVGRAAQAVPGQRLRFTSSTTRGPAREH
jgi:biotin-dependent carboxylase-like uncharacterized protein